MHTLKHLKLSDENLEKLETIKRKQTYMGAGLRITIEVGADDCDPTTIDAGVSTDVEILLDALLVAARDNAKYWRKVVERDVKEATEYLDAQDKKQLAPAKKSR